MCITRHSDTQFSLRRFLYAVAFTPFPFLGPWYHAEYIHFLLQEYYGGVKIELTSSGVYYCKIGYKIAI